MLKKIMGLETIYLFKTKEKSTVIESKIKTLLNVKSCFYGLEGINREEISLNLYSKFKLTNHYISQSETDKRILIYFFIKYFYSNNRHPENPKELSFMVTF